MNNAYARPSQISSSAQATALVLETAQAITPTGLLAHPQFFSGSVRRPDVAAAGLRTLVEIAQTRYFKPVPGGWRSLDPILTAHGDRLRCEAFSACNGVYARLDLMAQALDDSHLGLGTTNIDINPPLAAALAAIRPDDPLHLQVGASLVSMSTPSGTHHERQVDLPERWVRGLAETQSLAAGLPLRAELDAIAWRRFIHGLAMGGGSGAGVSQWLLPAATGLRATRQPQAGAVSLAGSARLAATKRLTHLIERVHIHGPDVSAGSPAALSAWVFQLPGARLTLMLSPEPWRGFSGEGAVLAALSGATQAHADTLAGLMAWETQLDLPALGEEARLTAARALLEQGLVQQHGAQFHVAASHGEHPHVVTLGANETTEGAGTRCTCAFWLKHQGTRGPCKHVLAAQLLIRA